MLSKNTCEGVNLIVKLPAISLQACKFTKNELFHAHFSRILASYYLLPFFQESFHERVLYVSLRGVVFQMGWGFIFKQGVCPIGGHRFGWGGDFRKKSQDGGGGGATTYPPLWETLGSYLHGRPFGNFTFSNLTNIHQKNIIQR